MAIQKTEKKAQLITKDKHIDLDVYSGTLGPDAVDVMPLFKHGYTTYDSGLTSTATCKSQITFIDGEKGLLLHRGYPIEQLASESNFLEVCYLLLNGELPVSTEYQAFCQAITHHAPVDEHLSLLFHGFKRDAHPMAMLLSVVGALSALYHDTLDIQDPEHRRLAAHQLIAKIPTLAAMCYRHTISQPFIPPNHDYTYAQNFLHMLFSTAATAQPPHATLARALDRIFILHADHEQNASTSTVRMAGSTGANPFACIAAGITALWGPAHGGANEAVLNMLHEIGDISRIDHYIDRAKDPNDSFRLMGFGHRVYKNYDPRAAIMRETCYEVLKITGTGLHPVFQLAMELEKRALQDSYFLDKKLYPNVDFYSGITLSAMGIPINMFTVIFALARTSGWIAQWNEMISHPYRLARPRQIYTGPLQRKYQAIHNR